MIIKNAQDKRTASKRGAQVQSSTVPYKQPVAHATYNLRHIQQQRYSHISDMPVRYLAMLIKYRVSMYDTNVCATHKRGGTV